MEKHIKRKLLEELKNGIAGKEVLIITGPRQSGKTTLMKELFDWLVSQRKNTLFLNFDYEGDKIYLKSQAALIDRIRLEFGDNQGYVFIDEIQRKKNAGLFLKGIYDLDLPYKFIVSGSGSLELKEKIHESLAGRKKMFQLHPLDFFEFVDFKTDYRYSDRLPKFFEIEKDKTKLFFDEYLDFGGYPRVVLSQTIAEKIDAISEIFSSVMERDISGFLRIDRPEAFSLLINILAAQTGQLIKYSELAKQAGISLPIVKKYLWYAQKIFIISILPPYFSNRQKEILKSPVPYFVDIGMRNFVARIFGNVGLKEKGFIFQNLINNMLLANLKPMEWLRFWRTNTGAEVDFVISRGDSILPVEVKYINLKTPAPGRSLLSFIEKYRPKEAWVVNLSLETEQKIKNTAIKYIPYWKL